MGRGGGGGGGVGGFGMMERALGRIGVGEGGTRG